MGELVSIVQARMDRYGTSEAELARRMGTVAQTLNTWRKRGIKKLPARWLLEALAREAGVPYETVLRAALVDIKYLDPPQPTGREDHEPAPIAPRDDPGIRTGEATSPPAAPRRRASRPTRGDGDVSARS